MGAIETQEMARILGFEEMDSRSHLLLSDFASQVSSDVGKDRDRLRSLFLEFESSRLDIGPEMTGELELRTLQVNDIMTRDVFCVQVDTKLTVLAGTLLRRMITGAPVVGKDGRLLGIVSQTDLAAAITLPDLRQRLENLTVGDVMTKFPLKVGPTDSVEDVLRLMLTFRLHRIVVTDDANLVAGIVTTLDMTRLLHQVRRHQV